MTFYLHPYPYRHLARRWAENNEQTLGVNVREEEDAYILSALVPGLHADDLKIQVLEDIVRIDGEHRADEQNYLLHELPHGPFTRTLRLPAPIDANHVDAQITDGVLTLRLPKAESARPKRIKITAR